jgi:sugar/nucleoside kinase (ribokinase family)
VSDNRAGRHELDLACVSYIAATSVLRLERYPQWNEGAPIRSQDSSLAGDGPLVAGFASGLGLTVGLETNAVAADDAGSEITAFLDRHRIAHTIEQTATRTPRAYILTHPDGGREWLVDLQRAAGDLASIGGALIRRAHIVYVDCFASISEGVVRAIELAGEHGRLVYANLGTLNLEPKIESALKSQAVAFVQASVPEEDAASARTVARDLAAQFDAVVYVTLSSLGAVALEAGEFTSASARPVEVDYTHGAGAAFSAGAIYGRHRGWSSGEILEFACALGSMQCTSSRMEAPTEPEVRAFFAATGDGVSVVVAGQEQ